MPDRRQINVLGMRIDNVTYEDALARMEEFIADGRAHLVVTVNPEFIMTARKDPDFARLLNSAHLALPDGQGVVWASRVLGSPLKERVTGVDTVTRMAALAAEKGYRVYLLGAAHGVAELASEQLCRSCPGLTVVGTHAGSAARDEEEEIVDTIRQAHPHVLFVAYGAPTQEKWIARNLSRLEVPVCMGVGGAFDFISGRSQRAPRWLQQLGLEWLHRLWRQPWRWRRMLALPRFAWLVFREQYRDGSLS